MADKPGDNGGTDAHEGLRPKFQTLSDDSAGTDMAVTAQSDLTAHHRTGSDMTPVTDTGIVLDDRASVENDARSQHCSSLHNSSGHELNRGTKRREARNAGTRMNDRAEFPAPGL